MPSNSSRAGLKWAMRCALIGQELASQKKITPIKEYRKLILTNLNQ